MGGSISANLVPRFCPGIVKIYVYHFKSALRPLSEYLGEY
jgi:hypothetical protein